MTQLQQNFQLGLGVAKRYSMKGLTQAQANGKSYINGLTEEWVAEFEYSTVKKQIGYLRSQLRETIAIIKESTEDLSKAIDKEEKEFYAEEIEKFLIVKEILTEMLSVMVRT